MQNNSLDTNLQRGGGTQGYKRIQTALFVLFSALILLVCWGYYLTLPPSLPAEGIALHVDKGMSVREIAKEAGEIGMVRSSLYLYVLLTYSYDPTSIYAGIYTVTEPMTVFEIAQKLAQSDIDATLMSVTIPEGVTRYDIAEIAKTKISSFNSEKFLELTKDKEGYLFPDTYFVSPDFTAESFVTVLTQTFNYKTEPLKPQILQLQLSLYEIITLASILEREAKDETSMKMVSGILQNRLAKNMPLQTDASIEYVLHKTLQELTPEDLEIDTPYNTYLYKGLTPTPIGNPGLQAIKAVLEPTPSDFLFYITGDDGVFHYAKTFEEHKRNIAKYLK